MLLPGGDEAPEPTNVAAKALTRKVLEDQIPQCWTWMPVLRLAGAAWTATRVMVACGSRNGHEWTPEVVNLETGRRFPAHLWGPEPAAAGDPAEPLESLEFREQQPGIRPSVLEALKTDAARLRNGPSESPRVTPPTPRTPYQLPASTRRPRLDGPGRGDRGGLSPFG
jgi:hypothetical protein